mmetsp:Transcript_9018/g.16258  ORF Transcript_9018/g.16258 Transcript_9018/m.16258 type:complete len:99 (-) Transcript_9018:117-413(-)
MDYHDRVWVWCSYSSGIDDTGVGTKFDFCRFDDIFSTDVQVIWVEIVCQCNFLVGIGSTIYLSMGSTDGSFLRRKGACYATTTLLTWWKVLHSDIEIG